MEGGKEGGGWMKEGVGNEIDERRNAERKMSGGAERGGDWKEGGKRGGG